MEAKEQEKRLWKTIIAKVRSERKYDVSVASSGIAVLLLSSGRTAHSRFKIPLELSESSCCTINHRTDLASLIQQASLFIWDEASTINRFAFEAVVRTIRDLVKNTPYCSEDRIFGGKLFVLGGDFRQILPVVSKVGHELTVSSSLPRSTIWRNCQVLHLRTNMQVLSSSLSPQMHIEYQNFASWVISVGEGNVQETRIYETGDANWIKIPKIFPIKNDKQSLDRLIVAVYPTFIN